MKILTLKGKIKLLSGLHIGGGDDPMKIGGIDSQVIKNTNTNEPYIPGSSLKGKMRSLLEWKYGLVAYNDGKPFGSDAFNNNIPKDKIENAKNLIKIFGDSSSNSKYGITRISVADCYLSEDSKNLILSEAKYENIINRKDGSANPRQIERVPEGVEFDFNIKLKIFNEEIENYEYNDDEEELKKIVKEGLELIKNDYLGGSGSRGYGRVDFIINEKWE